MEAAVNDFKNWLFRAWFQRTGASRTDDASSRCLPRESWDPELQGARLPLDPRFRGGSNLGVRHLHRGAGLFAIVSFAAALTAAPAAAQVPCGPHADVLSHLAQRYGEKPQVVALTDRKSVV